MFETLFGILSSWLFWSETLLAILVGYFFGSLTRRGGIGFSYRSMKRFIRMGLVVFFLYCAYAAGAIYSEWENEQNLLPEENIKFWLTFMPFFQVYMTMWALIMGFEKRLTNPLVFFSSEFYREDAPPKKSRAKKPEKQTCHERILENDKRILAAVRIFFLSFWRKFLTLLLRLIKA